MPDIVLDPNPASTIEASDEYKAAWFAAYGDGSPDEPPPLPPEEAEEFVIDESVLPDYLRRETVEDYIDSQVAEGLATYNPTLFQEFHFVEASLSWVCGHTLPRQVLDVVTVDTNGEEIIGDVTFSEGRVVIDWYLPQTGTARLST